MGDVCHGTGLYWLVEWSGVSVQVLMVCWWADGVCLFVCLCYWLSVVEQLLRVCTMCCCVSMCVVCCLVRAFALRIVFSLSVQCSFTSCRLRSPLVFPVILKCIACTILNNCTHKLIYEPCAPPRSLILGNVFVCVDRLLLVSTVCSCLSECVIVLCVNVFPLIPDCAYVCDEHYRADVEGQGEEQCAVLCRCCVCRL